MGTGTTLFIGAVAVVGLCVYSYRRYVNKIAQENYSKENKQIGTVEKPNHSTKTKPINQIAAKAAFINNLSQFSSLLPTLVDGSYSQNEVKSMWNDVIIDINDWDLINLWQLVRKNSESIKHILAQWGLTPDLCTQFQCMEFHKDMYEAIDGQPIVNGKEYQVISPCWILSKVSESGKTIKEVVTKGRVK